MKLQLKDWRCANIVHGRGYFTYQGAVIGRHGAMVECELTSGSWKQAGTIPAFAWTDWEKPRRVSVKMAGEPTAIRTEHFLNAGLARYR
jgi:hypothetical protein